MRNNTARSFRRRAGGGTRPRHYAPPPVHPVRDGTAPQTEYRVRERRQMDLLSPVKAGLQHHQTLWAGLRTRPPAPTAGLPNSPETFGRPREKGGVSVTFVGGSAVHLPGFPGECGVPGERSRSNLPGASLIEGQVAARSRVPEHLVTGEWKTIYR